MGHMRTRNMPLRLCLCASPPLCLCTAALSPLRLCASAPLHLCDAAPLRVCPAATLLHRCASSLPLSLSLSPCGNRIRQASPAGARRPAFGLWPASQQRRTATYAPAQWRPLSSSRLHQHPTIPRPSIARTLRGTLARMPLRFADAMSGQSCAGPTPKKAAAIMRIRDVCATGQEDRGGPPHSVLRISLSSF